MEIIKKLFEAGLLSEDDQTSLQEAYDARVAEATASAEDQVREEMAQRYEHDKAALVEAMGRSLTDVVKQFETQQAERVAENVAMAEKLKESQDRVTGVARDLKKAYRTRIKEHTTMLDKFVMSKLTSELGEFMQDKKTVMEMKVKYAQAVTECRDQYQAKLQENLSMMRKFVAEKLDGELTDLRSQNQALAEQQVQIAQEAEEQQRNLQESFADRIRKMDKFVVAKLGEELKEFEIDRKNLADREVALVKESRQAIIETQRKFIREAAAMVDKKVTETLKVELKQLHEDLEANRKNMFGRRIFEAVVSEYRSSYHNEGSEVRKLEGLLESTKAQLENTRTALNESKKSIEVSARKTRLAEEQSTRTKIMGELLTPLSRERRAVMQELLESVKTTALRESFNKYLPAVLNEDNRKNAPQKRQTLSEAPVKGSSTVAVTGNQRINRLQEPVKAEVPELSNETLEILRLAGRNK